MKDDTTRIAKEIHNRKKINKEKTGLKLSNKDVERQDRQVERFTKIHAREKSSTKRTTQIPRHIDTSEHFTQASQGSNMSTLRGSNVSTPTSTRKHYNPYENTTSQMSTYNRVQGGKSPTSPNKRKTSPLNISQNVKPSKITPKKGLKRTNKDNANTNKILMYDLSQEASHTTTESERESTSNESARMDKIIGKIRIPVYKEAYTTQPSNNSDYSSGRTQIQYYSQLPDSALNKVNAIILDGNKNDAAGRNTIKCSQDADNTPTLYQQSESSDSDSESEEGTWEPGII